MKLFNFLYIVIMGVIVSLFTSHFIIHRPPTDSSAFYWFLSLGIFNFIFLLYVIVRLAVMDVASEKKEKEDDK